MALKSSSWPTIPPDKWEELLRVTVEDLIRNEEGFDPEMTGIEAGLTAQERKTFKRWVDHLWLKEEARSRSGELSAATVRFMELLVAEATPDDRAELERDLERLKVDGKAPKT